MSFVSISSAPFFFSADFIVYIRRLKLILFIYLYFASLASFSASDLFCRQSLEATAEDRLEF